MSFDAVLFDLDGTLLDSIDLILESYRHTLRAHGLPPRARADVLSGLGTTLEDQFARWGCEPVEAFIATYVEHNLRVHDDLVRPYPGVNAVVDALHATATPLAVVTSKRRRGADRGLRALRLSERFDTLVCGDEVEHPKPHPEPVLRALSALGVEPSERVAFVGDASHDVRSGNAAGVRTIAVTWGAGTRVDLGAADVVVDDAPALAAALRVHR